VLVDELDRCHQEQVLDTLQAIRLFLSLPGTAFVLATDERVVRDAVRIRYAQAAMASETELPQEYLENGDGFSVR
jgi:predicted KAP-like P-loop ATPase